MLAVIDLGDDVDEVLTMEVAEGVHAINIPSFYFEEWDLDEDDEIIIDSNVDVTETEYFATKEITVVDGRPALVFRKREEK